MACGSRSFVSLYEGTFNPVSGAVGRLLHVTRIVVIDPQPAVRAGLAMMLRSEPGFVPVGSAVGAGDGLELVDRQRPDVVLLDPRLMDADGLAVCRRLRSLEHPPRVVLYVSEPDRTLPVTARVAGADGLVDKAERAE